MNIEFFKELWHNQTNTVIGTGVAILEKKYKYLCWKYFIKVSKVEMK